MRCISVHNHVNKIPHRDLFMTLLIIHDLTKGHQEFTHAILLLASVQFLLLAAG